MPKDMQDKECRDSTFIKVFNNEDGQAVLAYLKDLFEIKCPDTLNPNEMYVKLGEQKAVRFIENLLKGIIDGRNRDSD